MADTAAHLVDRVFPIVPVRQWVLSLPFALRYRMAYDACLTSDVLNKTARLTKKEPFRAYDFCQPITTSMNWAPAAVCVFTRKRWPSLDGA